MRIHVIIDFMHIYYKYFFQMRNGRLKRLTTSVDWNGSFTERDISLAYYSMRDIEGIRRQLEGNGHDVTISVCVDSKSKRNDEAGGETYKAGRIKSLSDENYREVKWICEILTKVGYNIYKIDGYEADDIVNQLVRDTKEDFDFTVIYTNDKDLLINITDGVGVMRFKQGVGYTQVDRNNYESYLEPEFKAYIPYNALGFYLSAVGDKADNIPGITKFGPKAFSKLITKLSEENEINWQEMGDYTKLAGVIDLCEKHLTPEQFTQLKQSFKLVSNTEVIEGLNKPLSKGTHETREATYGPYKMVSLIP